MAYGEGYGPLAIAHRGGSALAHENSLAAFELASALGLKYLETDIRVTGDGQLVCFHDDTLERVTSAAGPVRSKSLSEVRALRINGAEPIPTFDEALDAQDFETGTFAVQIRQMNGWTVLVEPNGYQSSLPETAAALSTGGITVVSVFWNVNAQMQFLLARDKLVLRRFDPLLPELVSEGAPLPDERDLVFGEAADDPRDTALALAGRLTAAPVTRRWLLDGAHPTFSTAAGWCP